MPVSLSRLRWLPALLVTGALCTAASMPGSSLPQFLHSGFDKITHGLVYGSLAASYLYGFDALGRKFPYHIATTTALICLAYALSEEWYQQFVPGRVSDPFDLRADIIGSLTVISLWLVIGLIRKRNSHA